MRYEFGNPLGQGGMGEVRKAWDPSLERYVALKVLSRPRADAVERMLREAQAQARVEHPNVCRVYEVVAESEIGPFIAMQLIDGEPLDVAARDLPLEQRVRLLRTVAEAVQAAHAVGLIHRDLKPANVLVEEREDGTFVPSVLDFGVARETEAPGPTVTGEVVGTPGYMSPEQARGAVRDLDRRSDIFSLGVLAFEILTGSHPFGDPRSLSAAIRILSDEQTSLAEVAPQLPKDLGTILETCLEHDRSRRYDSARALAEDLGRFLDGRPILARPASALDRGIKRVRRHPWAAAGLAAAVLASSIGAGAATMERRRATERARLAEELGQRVERMEASIRLSSLTPAHDLRPERALVEEEMAALRRELAEDGSDDASGLRVAALGRAAAALGRWEEAARFLEDARARGHATPQVAFALGHAKLQLYQRRLTEASRLGIPEAREHAVASARHDLAEPARELLREVDAGALGLGEQGGPYLEGLQALADGDHETALEAARRAFGLRSWFYEPRLLEADALFQRAFGKIAEGALDSAEEDLDTLNARLAAAEELAPSDPSIATRRCRAGSLEMIVRRDLGEEVEPTGVEAIAACRRALGLLPDWTPALEQLAELGWRQGDAAMRAGQDPSAALEIAEGAAEDLLTLEPDHPRARLHLGNVDYVRGRRAFDVRDDPTPFYLRAIEHFERAEQSTPGDGLLLLSLGHVWTALGTYRNLSGGSSDEAFDQAVDAYERGLTAPGGVESRLWSGICGVLNERGWALVQAADEGAEEVLERSVAACDAALEASPGYVSALNNRALGLWTLAESKARAGDGEAALRAAADAFREVHEDDPDRLSTRLNLANLLGQLASEQLDENRPVDREILDEAERVLAPVEDAWPADHLFVSTRLALVRARLQEQRELAGDEAERAWERVLSLAEDLRDGEVATFRTLPAAVDFHRAAATAPRRTVSERRRDVERGLEAVEGALRIKPDLVEALDLRNRLRELQRARPRLNGTDDRLSPDMPYQLVAELDAGSSVHALRDGTYDVGSARGADVRLRHPSVSRRHARLIVEDDRVRVEDLGSRNGTRIAGERLRGPREIEPGGLVLFGTVACRLEAVDAEDLEAGVRLGPPAATTPPTAPREAPASTAAAGSLPRFVLEGLPRVVQALERRDPVETVARQLGGELFETLPCHRVRMTRNTDSGETAVLFLAERDEAASSDAATRSVCGGPPGEFGLEVDFRQPLQARTFRPLLETGLRLLGLAAPGAPRRGTETTGQLPSPPEPPAPRSVEPEILALYRDAARVARGEISVLVTGESGTGKEVLARYVHAASTRAEGPFLALNCAALPRDLLEAELFGVESGVATGVSSRPGKFELASDGTLFLDELGDMAPETQARILRVLQEGEVYRLGGRDPRPARARIVAATNRDLGAMLETGDFRSDLYHRIADWKIRIPPLRERRRDIPNLAAHFLTEEARRLGVAPAGISNAALERLCHHAWPGNVRQLQREMARACLFLGDGEFLQTRHLQAEVREPTAPPARTLAERLERVEKAEIEAALRRCDSNVSAAGRELDVSRSTLYRRMRELGIGEDDPAD